MKKQALGNLLWVSFFCYLGGYTPKATAYPVPRLSQYCTTYTECRSNFQTTANRIKTSLPTSEREAVQVGKWQIPSRLNQDLSTDYVYFPATQNPKNLIILSSGVHGIEGFAGSAIQQLFLNEILPKLDRSKLGILVIHAVNPYGMEYFRRVSENNVDLNRNFDVNRDLFRFENKGYVKLNSILNPEWPLSSSLLITAGLYYHLLKLLIYEPMKVLREAILQGQYQYAKGLYFGGTDFEPHKNILEPEILDKAKPYQNVLIMDLHTGYGNRGVLHLMPSTYPNKEVEAATKAVFQNYPIEDPQGPDFYYNYGDFSAYVGKLLLNENKHVVPLVLEYGTLNNTTTLGSLSSLRRMIGENQLHWYGSKNAKSEKKVHQDFFEMYLPSDSKWRNSMMSVSSQNIPVWISNFQKLSF